MTQSTDDDAIKKEFERLQTSLDRLPPEFNVALLTMKKEYPELLEDGRRAKVVAAYDTLARQLTSMKASQAPVSMTLPCQTFDYMEILLSSLGVLTLYNRDAHDSLTIVDIPKASFRTAKTAVDTFARTQTGLMKKMAEDGDEDLKKFEDESAQRGEKKPVYCHHFPHFSTGSGPAPVSEPVNAQFLELFLGITQETHPHYFKVMSKDKVPMFEQDTIVTEFDGAFDAYFCATTRNTLLLVRDREKFPYWTFDIHAPTFVFSYGEYWEMPAIARKIELMNKLKPQVRQFMYVEQTESYEEFLDAVRNKKESLEDSSDATYMTWLLKNASLVRPKVPPLFEKGNVAAMVWYCPRHKDGASTRELARLQVTQKQRKNEYMPMSQRRSNVTRHAGGDLVPHDVKGKGRVTDHHSLLPDKEERMRSMLAEVKDLSAIAQNVQNNKV